MAENNNNPRVLGTGSFVGDLTLTYGFGVQTPLTTQYGTVAGQFNTGYYLGSGLANDGVAFTQLTGGFYAATGEMTGRFVTGAAQDFVYYAGDAGAAAGKVLIPVGAGIEGVASGQGPRLA